MVGVLQVVLSAAMAVTAGAALATPLTYEPVGLAWSAEEVDHATEHNSTDLLARARHAGQLGCIRHCERLERIFTRLVHHAREQTARASSLPWTLTVVRLPDVEAMAMPGGQVFISEDFVDRHAAHDEALAFVLAHEMAHSILEHERQALTFARLLLPRHVHRSVKDMYTEMDHNLGLLKAMEPVMQQGELEADELGLLLASAAGYSPELQLHFLALESAGESDIRPIVSTHPPLRRRLDELIERLPLARKLMPDTGP